jgi:hypothetical protein
MTPKGANLEATDLLEISELSGTGYITKSITGQEIINAGGGGGSQDLQQVTNLGSTTTETIIVLDNPSSTNYLSIISNSAVEVANNITLEQTGLFSDKIEIIKNELSISRGGNFKISNVSSPRIVTLEFPDKPTGSYTIATTADIPSVSGFVPYTGATADVNLGTFDLDAAKGTFTHNGSTDTLTANHTSGSGIGLSITKGGANEGLKVNKTSGSGNAATIIGTLEATTIVKTGGTSSQFLMADGSTNTNVVPTSRTLNGFDLSADRTFTTAVIADSVNKRYVTDANLTVLSNTSNTNTGDETQASILSKLGFFVNNRTSDTTAVTGTTTETIIDSVLIPANTYSASGGILRLYNAKFAKTGTAGTLRVKIYIGPNAGNLTGATLLADSGSLANTILYTEMLRTFTVGSATLKGINSGVIVLSDVISSNSARSSIAWNPAIDNYIHYTVINASAADSTVMIGNSVKNF